MRMQSTYLQGVAIGLLLFCWKVSAFVWNEGACVPPSDPTAPVGLRGYARFFSNDSLVGRPVPCTREDKICFRHNLVFYPNLDRCQPVNTIVIDCVAHEGCLCLLKVNRTELEHGSGRLVGSCSKYTDPCPGHRMAYDGKCYQWPIVRDVICGCSAKSTYHILGEMECREKTHTPITIQQPDEDGSCVIPDLRNPDKERTKFLHNPLESIQGVNVDKPPSFECDTNQIECFAKEKVWVSGFPGCHTLLERGPCAEDHVVALDLQAAVQGRAEGTCAHVRDGCPQGHKRMLFDGECHEDREIAIEVPGIIIMNQFAKNFIRGHFEFIKFIPALVDNTFCVIEHGVYRASVATRAVNPPCGADDSGECKLYDVETDRPKPEF